MIKFTIITLFREALEPYLKTSMMWKAQEKGIVEFDFVNLRDFGLGPHKSVDDTPYGGGDGMVLACQPIFDCYRNIKKQENSIKPLQYVYAYSSKTFCGVILIRGMPLFPWVTPLTFNQFFSNPSVTYASFCLRL